MLDLRWLWMYEILKKIETWPLINQFFGFLLIWWNFPFYRELIMRSVLAMQSDPALLEQMGKNITRQGLTHHTLNFLRLCVILEPMQELMSRQKAFNLGPRECLKTTLFQKWQRMVAPPGEAAVELSECWLGGKKHSDVRFLWNKN